MLDRIGDLAYKLGLPPTLPVHDVFYVRLLKPWRAGSREQPPPAPVVVDGEEEWHVEAIPEYSRAFQSMKWTRGK